MNEATELFDDDDENDFDENDIIFDVIIDKAENNETQVNADEAV